jgi:hypothetical protein
MLTHQSCIGGTRQHKSNSGIYLSASTSEEERSMKIVFAEFFLFGVPESLKAFPDKN